MGAKHYVTTLLQRVLCPYPARGDIGPQDHNARLTITNVDVIQADGPMDSDYSFLPDDVAVVDEQEPTLSSLSIFIS